MSSPDRASPLDHIGSAFSWLVSSSMEWLIFATLTLGPVWVIVWALELSHRVLALAAVPWLLKAANAVTSSTGSGRAFARSAGVAAVCVGAAWWLS